MANTSRFDAGLVPITDGVRNRWLLAIEDGLAIQDQVTLYGHALGHLLLNREAHKMGQMPPLDPCDGYALADTLSELRMLESARQSIDRRVLEAFPPVTTMLREREEPPSQFDSSVFDLRQRLGEAGWRGPLVASPYVFTDGRVYLPKFRPN